MSKASFIIACSNYQHARAYLGVPGNRMVTSRRQILRFTSRPRAQHYFRVFINSHHTRRQILTKCRKTDFEIVKCHFPSSFAKKEGQIWDTVRDAAGFLSSHLPRTLVLDLEFYPVKNSRRVRMRQIGGVVLGTGHAFNHFVYEPKLMPARYCRKVKLHCPSCSNGSYSASRAVSKAIAFCRRNHVDTVLSWGNALDFSVLREEGFGKFVDFFGHAFDLEPAFDRDPRVNVSPSLENVCQYLRLKNTGTWHNALSDSLMVRRVVMVCLKKEGLFDEVESF